MYDFESLSVNIAFFNISSFVQYISFSLDKDFLCV